MKYGRCSAIAPQVLSTFSKIFFASNEHGSNGNSLNYLCDFHTVDPFPDPLVSRRVNGKKGRSFTKHSRSCVKYHKFPEEISNVLTLSWWKCYQIWQLWKIRLPLNGVSHSDNTRRSKRELHHSHRLVSSKTRLDGRTAETFCFQVWLCFPLKTKGARRV